MIHSPTSLSLLKAWIYEILFKVKPTPFFCPVAFALRLQYFDLPWAQYGPVILGMPFVCRCCSLPKSTFSPRISVTIEKLLPVQDKKLPVCKVLFVCFAWEVQDAKSSVEHCSFCLILWLRYPVSNWQHAFGRMSRKRKVAGSEGLKP